MVRRVEFSAEILRSELLKQGRSQVWLAGQIGYSAEMVNRVLNGTQPMHERFAVRAAIALDLSVESLLADQPEPVTA